MEHLLKETIGTMFRTERGRLTNFTVLEAKLETNEIYLLALS